MIGSVAVGHDGGAYIMVRYFTSEADREGERKEIPAELRANMDEMSKLSVGETEFFDLRQPMIHSPK